MRPWLNEPNDEWHMGQYGKPYPEGHEHHGSVPIYWRRVIVLGVARKWPAGVPVAPRKVEGLRDAPEGVEEGAMCLRNHGPTLATICRARLVLEPDPDYGGCSCFISAPCGSCMSRAPECPRGCWRDESRP